MSLRKANILLIWILVSVFISCSESDVQSKRETIVQFDTWRHRILLTPIDGKLNLDSALYFKRDQGVCDYCGGVTAIEDSFEDSYRSREFYSYRDSTLKNYRKEVIWNVDSGQYVLVLEKDIYKKMDPRGFEIELIVAIGAMSGVEKGYRTFLEIDTIPNAQNLRIAEVKAGIEPKEGYDVCGTAYDEFLKEYFPERHVALDTNKIEYYLKQFRN